MALVNYLGSRIREGGYPWTRSHGAGLLYPGKCPCILQPAKKSSTAQAFPGSPVPGTYPPLLPTSHSGASPAVLKYVFCQLFWQECPWQGSLNAHLTNNPELCLSSKNTHFGRLKKIKNKIKIPGLLKYLSWYWPRVACSRCDVWDAHMFSGAEAWRPDQQLWAPPFDLSGKLGIELGEARVLLFWWPEIISHLCPQDMHIDNFFRNMTFVLV